MKCDVVVMVAVSGAAASSAESWHKLSDLGDNVVFSNSLATTLLFEIGHSGLIVIS